ncbi:RNF25 [Acanthosepion pharaonis]|uniref:E3 ubiquitin-protein ligase RNF25 n=1 Tax=Acanthosepion pharaonis TaxID=158019 RepID=A0A812CGI4_ACAPH|nr:RNF25 [Sepia pharaonis]
MDAQACAPNAESTESGVSEELAILESIYINELNVEKDDQDAVKCITCKLHPSTGDDVHKQYVCLTLVLSLPNTYPQDVPDITIKNPRGLGEEELNSLKTTLRDVADERKGGPMLYELLELAKESLTEGNIPRQPCVICQQHFEEGESFTRTECYHYFHCHCLGRYVQHCLNEVTEVSGDSQAAVASQPLQNGCDEPNKDIVCPVCRENISYDLDSWLGAPEPCKDNSAFKLSDDLVLQQKQMAALLEKQRVKGGLIDLEAERNKYLISAGECITTGTKENSSEETLPVTENVQSDDQDTKDKKSDHSDKSASPLPSEQNLETNDHKANNYRDDRERSRPQSGSGPSQRSSRNQGKKGGRGGGSGGGGGGENKGKNSRNKENLQNQQPRNSGKRNRIEQGNYHQDPSHVNPKRDPAPKKGGDKMTAQLPRDNNPRDYESRQPQQSSYQHHGGRNGDRGHGRSSRFRGGGGGGGRNYHDEHVYESNQNHYNNRPKYNRNDRYDKYGGQDDHPRKNDNGGRGRGRGGSARGRGARGNSNGYRNGGMGDDKDYYHGEAQEKVVRRISDKRDSANRNEMTAEYGSHGSHTKYCNSQEAPFKEQQYQRQFSAKKGSTAASAQQGDTYDYADTEDSSGYQNSRYNNNNNNLRYQRNNSYNNEGYYQKPLDHYHANKDNNSAKNNRSKTFHRRREYADNSDQFGKNSKPFHHHNNPQSQHMAAENNGYYQNSENRMNSSGRKAHQQDHHFPHRNRDRKKTEPNHYHDAERTPPSRGRGNSMGGGGGGYARQRQNSGGNNYNRSYGGQRDKVPRTPPGFHSQGRKAVQPPPGFDSLQSI